MCLVELGTPYIMENAKCVDQLPSGRRPVQHVPRKYIRSYGATCFHKHIVYTDFQPRLATQTKCNMKEALHKNEP